MIIIGIYFAPFIYNFYSSYSQNWLTLIFHQFFNSFVEKPETYLMLKGSGNFVSDSDTKSWI